MVIFRQGSQTSAPRSFTPSSINELEHLQRGEHCVFYCVISGYRQPTRCHICMADGFYFFYFACSTDGIEGFEAGIDFHRQFLRA
jgi:hypothetical protein